MAEDQPKESWSVRLAKALLEHYSDKRAQPGFSIDFDHKEKTKKELMELRQEIDDNFATISFSERIELHVINKMERYQLEKLVRGT